MKRILWHSTPGHIATGYGQQTRVFVPAIASAGYEIAVSAIQDQYHTAMREDILHFANGPRINLGNDFIDAHIDVYKPDAVISMIDTFIVDTPKITSRVPWHPFVMVDSDPIHPVVDASLHGAGKAISCTKWTQRIMEKAGYESYYCPLAINTDDYYPVDKEEARDTLSCELHRDLKGKFLVVSVAANMSRPCRKNFGAMLKAWSIFHKIFPESYLYIHTETTGTLSRGEDMMRSVRLYNVEDSVIFPDQYKYVTGLYGEKYLNTVYNAANLYLCTSRGEGFGLPIVEAQAAGCPALTPCWGAMEELNFSGCLADGDTWMYDPGAEQFLVYPRSVALQMERFAATPFTGDIVKKAKEYDIENVMDKYMKPILAEITKEKKNEKTV